MGDVIIDNSSAAYRQVRPINCWD